jgi:hypothetical protein
VRSGVRVADKVLNAVYFDVFEEDVFGTGRLPDPGDGRVVVDHSWVIENGTEPRGARVGG